MVDALASGASGRKLMEVQLLSRPRRDRLIIPTASAIEGKYTSVGLADEFERRLERVVEGFFSKAFRSKVEPAEIGRRLLREMEGGKSVSVAAVYVPNHYEIRLSTVDHERLEGLLPTLQSEFAQMLEANAVERKWRPAGAMGVSFEPHGSVSEGRFEILAEHDSSAPPETTDVPTQPTQPILVIGDVDPPRQLVLDSDRMVIGRLEECDLVLADPQISRRHAELTRREDGWWIADLGTTNGTMVNATMVNERRLRAGDHIQVGNTEIEYREPKL